MKLDVLEHKKNPLMHREEILVGLDHSGKPTPNRKDIMSELVKKLKTKEDLIIIDKIFTTTGKSASEARVLVYKKPGDIPKYKIEKMKRRMEKKKKEKPAPKPEEKKEEAKPAEGEAKPEEEAKEDKPAEQPKEESKPEEKKEETPTEETKKDEK